MRKILVLTIHALRLVSTIVVMTIFYVSSATASTIFVTGGTLASQQLSGIEWEIDIAPGNPLTGNVLIQVNTTGTAPSVVFPLGYTWTWEQRETSMVKLSGDAPFGESNWDVPINLTAPTEPGRHYLLFGVRGEYTLSQLFSCTNWTRSGGVVWNDGNDYHDMTDTALLLAHQTGFVKDWPVLFSDGYKPGGNGVAVAPVAINVVPIPATIWMLLSGIGVLTIVGRRYRR